MKIYATVYNTIRSDSEFLGKDIWVRCLLYPKEYPTPGYARFLKYTATQQGGIVEVNFLSDFDLGPMSHFTDRGKCTQAVITKEYSTDKILIYTPVETITTFELLPLYKSNSIDVFEEFVGQDVWIKSRVRNTKYESYIKVIKITDNYMICNNIGTEWVYIDDIYDDDLAIRPSEQISPENLYHLDYWEVVEPLDILTDGEMQELLEDNDRLWRDYEE